MGLNIKGIFLNSVILKTTDPYKLQRHYKEKFFTFINKSHYYQIKVTLKYSFIFSFQSGFGDC